MTEQQIIEVFETSSGNAEARCKAVNALRHKLMDPIPVNTKDDSDYMFVYEKVMKLIADSYPELAWEVQRQVAKKKRRHSRNSLVGSSISAHI